MDRDDTRYLTVTEACERLRLHRDTVYDWIKDGKLEAVKRPGRGRFGGEWLIPESEIKRVLQGAD